MRRGFKAEAERRATALREELSVAPDAALDVVALARHVGADVRSADELTSMDKLEALEKIQPGAFSACTYFVGGKHVIVYNPISSERRRQSDVAHEVAHLVLDHTLRRVEHVGAFTFFTCDPDEEQEANWLAGCLLLPRALLYKAARRGMDPSAIAQEYGVNEQMASFRLRTTGVERQIDASRGTRSG